MQIIADPNMKDFLDIVKTRKTIRSFSTQRVPADILEKILRIATYAPTNCNQQLWNFIVVEDDVTKERLVKEAASTTILRRAPTIVAVTYDGWNYKEAIQGASLALGHMLLASVYYGVCASPLNSYGADSKVKEILGIPESETICCFVTLGYPDDRAVNAPPVPRRPVEEVVHRGKFVVSRKPPFSYNPADWTLADLRNHQKYYCRKTFLGKEMDIMSWNEREIVREELQNTRGPVLDIFSYDGNYLREFPDVAVETVDLAPETAEYTHAAVKLYKETKDRLFVHGVYEESAPTLSATQVSKATMIYKAERLPPELRGKVFKQACATLSPDGELLIISRKTNFFLLIFFAAIRIFFGKDLRRTGIFNFFGPYQPIKVGEVLRELEVAGFKKISWSGYFFIPTFYEQVYQMVLQYFKSEGSSYLHREQRKNFISQAMAFIMKLQGMRRVGIFGSVVVIKARK